MKRIHYVLMVVSIMLVAVALPPLYRWGNRRYDAYLWEHAQRAMDAEEFAEAESYAARLLARSPNGPVALLAGDAAMQLEAGDRALQYLRPLLAAEDADAVTAMSATGVIYLQKADAAEAERWFSRALELDPDRVFPAQNLVYLLTLEGRGYAALPWRFRLLKKGEFTADDLCFLGNPRALIRNDDLAAYTESDPDNPMWLLAQARLALRDSRTAEARTLFRRVVAQRPDLAEAQVGLGMALLDESLPEAFWLWHQQVPKQVQWHPDLWAVRGLWAQRHGQPRAAIRCFWEALRREPTHQLASYQLSAALVAAGEPERAKPFEGLSKKLSELLRTVDLLLTYERGRIDMMFTAARQTEALGRYWESAGWLRAVLMADPDNPKAQLALGSIAPRLSASLPRVADSHNPAAGADFSAYPLPHISRPSSTQPGRQGPRGKSSIRFVDVAQSAGLTFQFFNGEDLQTPGRRMFEFTGGGMAVLDFDRDGWPDIYLTQGRYWPRREGQPHLHDQMFRNLGDGRFEEVTEQAGLGDDRFSQGVAAGDFDSDGYDDLYLCNIGDNRLYHNNGDGTFSDVSDLAGIGGQHWTSNGLIADLNGDGIADLFEANYLAGNTAELMCRRTCSPVQFDAEPNRFFLGTGDGRFTDQTREAGLTGADGKSFAVAAFDLDESGRLSLFVANDMTANFCYSNEGTRGGPPHFVESAMVRGLAVDREGNAQACMGVAVGDANGDGLVDLYIGNFYREYNVLYEQLSSGVFADVTRRRGLAAESFLLLTFGTQFVDLDLDGDADLVAANGNVDDFRAEGLPYQMPHSVLSNEAGQFMDVTSQCGPFFQGKYLGRGLALLDWNRDGKVDWTVSHLDSPAALLENRTTEAGHSITLHLVGTTCHRDALGTRCRVVAGKLDAWRQLVGGGSYDASSEKSLVLGLGPAARADRIEIHWAGGRQQVFQDVPADREYTVVEGWDELQEMPRD